ncbi:hypothetical protein BGZ46_006420, partial [Entomortierella lignicola]
MNSQFKIPRTTNARIGNDSIILQAALEDSDKESAAVLSIISPVFTIPGHTSTSSGVSSVTSTIAEQPNSSAIESADGSAGGSMDGSANGGNGLD